MNATDPDGAGSRLYPATRTTYNADGQATAVEQGTTLGQSDASWSAFSPLQTATTAYDAQGRKVRDTAAAGTADAMVTQYSYDAASRLTCTARRMNPAVYGSLPTSACVLGTTGANGPDRIAFSTYDDADRLLSTTNGYLSGTTITESQTWTTNGKVATRTDGNGNLSTYVYDGFDRVSRLRFPNASGGGSSTTDYEEYGYDAASNRTSLRNRAGETLTSAFDALNRKVALNVPAGDGQTWGFDNLDRMVSGVMSLGPSMTNTWDALGRIISVQSSDSPGSLDLQYDLAGRRTRERLRTPVNFIVHTQTEVDDALAHGRYFFMDILADGIELLSAPDAPAFAETPPLAPETALAETGGCLGRDRDIYVKPTSRETARRQGSLARTGQVPSKRLRPRPVSGPFRAGVCLPLRPSGERARQAPAVARCKMMCFHEMALAHGFSQ